MYGAPLKSLRVSRKDFFSTHRKSLFCPCVSAPFFWVHKSISGNAHHVHQYIFISLQRSFFKRVVVLMRRAKSRRLGERPEQSRAMGHPCKRRTLSPEEREKYTSDFDPFFFFSSSLGVAAVSGLFSLFFGSVRLFTHTHT